MTDKPQTIEGEGSEYMQTDKQEMVLPLVRIGEPCPDEPHHHTSSLHQTECDIRKETSQETRRDDWFGLLQQFLEERIADAPDETCRALARDLWQETANFTDDD